jgi:hypothetical protein
LEVCARLTSPLSEALDRPDPEAPSDEIVQRDAPNDEVTPGLDRHQLDAFGGQLLQRFGLHPGKSVATSPFPSGSVMGSYMMPGGTLKKTA